MTYLQFHLVFILPPLLLLAVLARGARARLGGRAVWSLPLLMLVAFVYTTPWDNYLVYRGIWNYGADRVIGTIGYVPVEEYMFFLLQPLLTGLWLYVLLLREPDAAADEKHARGAGIRPSSAHPPHARRTRAFPIFAAAYGIVSIAGVWMLFYTRTLYLGLILAWAAPVLLGQWMLVAPAMQSRARVALLAIGVPTLYLWVADSIAIGSGIWSISTTYTTGAHLFGLPIEEATFFLVTNVLVVQGLLLFLFPDELRPLRSRA